MKINISPKSFTTEATSISIQTVGFNLNEGADFIIHYHKEDGTIFENDRIYVIGEEFAAWGSDDNYIIDLALTKLGLEKA
jgi:hypothetical protein